MSKATEFIVQLLEEIIEVQGKPREILSDNGSVYRGIKKGDNEFDTFNLTPI